jgi:2-methylfumaryl-CoA hydratase
VRSCGVNQRGQIALDYCRWVMVRKRDPASPAPASVVPDLPDAVAAGDLIVPPGIRVEQYDCRRCPGSPDLWDDYQVGERIDHVDGMTIEESEHMMATRLYQNTARVHFNQQAEKRRALRPPHHLRRLHHQPGALAFLQRPGQCLQRRGDQRRPACLAGLCRRYHLRLVGSDRADGPAGRNDLGALRLRTVATKDQPCADFPYKTADGRYDPSVLLDFDYTVLVPRRA